MGKATEELIAVLNDIEAVLSVYDEEHWFNLISSANQRIKNSDYSGIEQEKQRHPMIKEVINGNSPQSVSLFQMISL